MYKNVFEGNDTIIAISSPIGRGPIGIIRLSGSDSFKISEKLFTSTKGKRISEQRGNTILHGKIKLEDEKIEDYVLAAIFKAPNSYTGEDMVELNCHSNLLMLQLILESAIINGARLAEAGEFTKRAFLNNKL
ncbi:tRNA uridine-5-carboxymethylaminomethyl(34) synthesis GTPase MnmE, partial [bacterium]|nr:tRNA uridine-5-carboxymethylaminomethyl(34) synthesis GTPase MnmE [bacterium]